MKVNTQLIKTSPSVPAFFFPLTNFQNLRDFTRNKINMVSLPILCIFVSIFSIVYSSTAVTQCKGTAKSKPVMTEGFLGDCVTPPCAFKRGEKTWINMTFTTDETHSKLTNNIFATMMGIKHGYPGLNGINACTFITAAPPNSGSGCPLEKGVTYNYAVELDVKKSFPKVSVPLHFAIKDEDTGREVACLECTIKIV